MVYTADTFWNAILGSIQGINVFQHGTNYIPIGFLLLITMIMISPRNLSNMKVLLLPLMVGFATMGIHIPLLFLVLAGVLFVIENLSTKGIGNFIEIATQEINKVISIPERIREKRTVRTEKDIVRAKREKAIREAELRKLIPFRRGTKRSDIIELQAEQERKKILRMKSKSKRDRELESFFNKYFKKKENVWEVNE